MFRQRCGVVWCGELPESEGVMRIKKGVLDPTLTALHVYLYMLCACGIQSNVGTAGQDHRTVLVKLLALIMSNYLF
jgi:hypothetical protein